MAELTADVAIRRPQAFLPAPGALVEWRVLEGGSGAELQRGSSTAAGDGLVVLAGIRIPKDPGVRIEARAEVPVLPGAFRRGDTNGDGREDLSDAVRTLIVLFIDPAVRLACEDAADANDDGRINIADPSFALNYLFLGGPEPPAPGSASCGVDPTADALTACEATCR
jgi:hypothetical protein